MFRAIQRADHAALRTLAQTFLKMKDDTAALLCLDHIFSSPPKLRNLPLPNVQAMLSMYFDYISLLNKFRRDESFANGSNHQTLFGFQALGENRWLVPKRSLLHGKLVNISGSTAGKSADGYRCGFDELRRGITAILESRIQDRTRVLNEACRDVHGFSPCPRLFVQEKCNLPNGQGPCTFQHLKPEQFSVGWYHTRLRLILLQFQILESARLYDFHVAKCVAATLTPQDVYVYTNQTYSYWLKVLYSTLHPPLQSLGSLAKLAIARIPETFVGLGVVQNWVRCVSHDLNNSSPWQADCFRRLSVVVCTLAFDFGRKDARNFVPRAPIYKSKLWPISPFRGAGNLIVQDLVAFLTAEDGDSLTLGLSYLRYGLRDVSKLIHSNFSSQGSSFRRTTCRPERVV